MVVLRLRAWRTTPAASASSQRPPFRRGLGPLGCDRGSIGRIAPLPRDERERALPEADQASGRDEHDHEEDRADQRVEARADEADLLRVVVEDDEHERPDPRALEPVEAADDGDHEHVDRRAEVDRRRVDVAVPPDEEHAADRGDERRRSRTRSCGAARRCSRATPSAPGRRGPPAASARTACARCSAAARRRRATRRARRSRAGSGARSTLPIRCGVGMPLIPPKPGDVGHLAEEEVRDHASR